MPIIFEAAQPNKLIEYNGLKRPAAYEDLQQVLDAIHNTVSSRQNVSIGVAEIHDGGHEEKMPPLEYASWVKDRTGKDIVLYRAPPYFPKVWHEQEGYVSEAVGRGINNLVIAGARDSHHLPGYTPLEFTQRLKDIFGEQIFIGGITIPTRENEPQKLVEKTRAGMRYFRSQQIFDARPVEDVLEGYWSSCQEHDIAPRRIFLSFVPILNENTIGKLRQLGIAIPEDVEKAIYANGDRKLMRKASIATAKRLLSDICEYIDKHRIGVPVGLDVESFFAGRVSVEIAAELMEELAGIAKHYSNPLKGSS